MCLCVHCVYDDYCFFCCFRLAFFHRAQVISFFAFRSAYIPRYMWFTSIASALVTFACYTHAYTHTQTFAWYSTSNSRRHTSIGYVIPFHSTVQHRISIFRYKCVCFGNFTSHVARRRKNDTKKYTIPFYSRIFEIFYRLWSLGNAMGNHAIIFILSVLWVRWMNLRWPNRIKLIQ